MPKSWFVYMSLTDASWQCRHIVVTAWATACTRWRLGDGKESCPGHTVLKQSVSLSCADMGKQKESKMTGVSMPYAHVLHAREKGCRNDGPLEANFAVYDFHAAGHGKPTFTLIWGDMWHQCGGLGRERPLTPLGFSISAHVQALKRSTFHKCWNMMSTEVRRNSSGDPDRYPMTLGPHQFHRKKVHDQAWGINYC